MIEPASRFPDNPAHANGTCEACGAPCAVYGCRWCPACYHTEDVRAQRLGFRDAASLDAHRAFQRLSPKAKLDYWLRVNGQARSTDDVRECPSLRELVAAAQDWLSVDDRLPTEDRYGRLRYMVYAPAYGGWLWRCRYVGWGDWVSDSVAGNITVVSHWRLARDGEQERQAKAAELPRVTRNDLT